MKRYISVICFALIYSLHSKSQINLVQNPSFENHSSCPDFGGELNRCNNWNNVNLIYNDFTVGSPDYFHSCGSGGVVPPNTFAGQCLPHTGNAMTALVMYNSPYPEYREYMSSQLSCAMIPGNTYTVSFWITNGLNPISQYRIKNIGVHFSGSPLSQSGWNVINVTPQVEITNLAGSTNWVKYSFTITPTATWNYLTIGAFRPDSQNSPTSTYSITTGPASVYANYFFDDIEVLTLGTSGSFSTTSTINNVTCNGGTNGSATVTPINAGNYSYSWSPGNYSTSNVSNLSAGVYTVTINDAGCNINTTTISITQPSPLTSIITASSYTVCSNQSVSLNSSVAGGTPFYTVNWSTGVFNATSVTVNPTVTSVYSYTVTDSNMCTKTQSVTVLVQKPISNFTMSSVPCSGIVTFTNLSSNSNSYNWTFGNSNSSSNPNPGSMTYTGSGTYSVQLITSSSIGCKDSIIKSISVSVPIPITVNQYHTQILCNGGTASATVSPVGAGPFSYSWSPNNNATAFAANLPAGVYTVNVSSSGCETGSSIISITQPSLLSSTLSVSAYTICDYSSSNISVQNSGGTPGYSINWNTGQTSNTIIVAPTANTIYSYTVTDTNNCIVTNSVQIIVETVVADFNSSNNTCTSKMSFTNTSTNSNTVLWDFGDGNSNTSVSTIQNNYLSYGTYAVSLIATSPIGCKDTVMKTILIDSSSVIADFDFLIKEFSCTDSVMFVNRSSGAISYLWDLGDGTLSNFSSVTHNYYSGTYIITLISSDNLCKDTIAKQITISISNDQEGLIPNVFTPNNDGVNDIFDFKKIIPCEEFTFSIYDRWGLLILDSKYNHQKFWDGRTTAGEITTEGTYFFILDTEEKKIKGTVTLFR